MTGVLDFESFSPELANGVYVAPGAFVIGRVRIGERSSVWYNSVVRGDVGSITIGARTNIQDLSVIHISGGTWDTTIGDDVTVGHRAILHGCTIGNNTLIGMGAIILDGAVVGDNCLIGAGSIVTPGTVIPPGSLALGSPARVKRALTQTEIEYNTVSASHYADNAERHATAH